MAESELQIEASTTAENMLQQQGNEQWYMDLASRKAEEACTNKPFFLPWSSWIHFYNVCNWSWIIWYLMVFFCWAYEYMNSQFLWCGTIIVEITFTNWESCVAALRRHEAAAWLGTMVGEAVGKKIPAQPSEEEFRLVLRSGIILCNVLNKVQPGAVPKVGIVSLSPNFFLIE